jgi:Transposase
VRKRNDAPDLARPPGTTECEQDHRALLLGNGEQTRTASTSRRGRKNDPLYRSRRTLHTGADLLTDKQTARLTALFAIDEHIEVEATWGIYQRMIAAYRHPDPAAGRELMVKLIDSLSAGVPRPLVEMCLWMLIRHVTARIDSGR